MRRQDSSSNPIGSDLLWLYTGFLGRVDPSRRLFRHLDGESLPQVEHLDAGCVEHVDHLTARQRLADAHR